MTSSLTSRLPASTIRIASAVPATTMFSVPAAICSLVGLTMNCPSTWPMRTAPTGPSNGTREIVSEAEAPLSARMSVSLIWSAE